MRLQIQFLLNGVLGVAVTGLLAAFMAGMAANANVSSFNTVFTYDIWQSYIRRDRPDIYYLRVGRIVTVVGILIGIVTAFIASGYSNIMNYIQLLFSFFNAPLFAPPESAAAKLFDLRVLIGALFTLYGVILIVAGLLASAAERHKAAGIDINLWMGIGMLVLGLLFLLWWRLQPLPAPAEPGRDSATANTPRSRSSSTSRSSRRKR